MVKEHEDGEGRLTAWGPRVLAPLAFFAAVTVLALLVQSSLGGNSTSSSTTFSTVFATTPTGTGTSTVGKPGKRKNYRIKQGDTLEAIAERFDTTVDDLITLNPGIEANALEPGTRIRVQ